MAQKTEKEETEFKVPETLTLCVNNCGVTGNPATKNMCQKCFNATTATTSSSSPSSTANATSGGGAVAGGASSGMKFSGEPSSRSGTSRSLEIRSDSVSGTTTTGSQSSSLDNSGVVETLSMVEKKVVNRCSGCGKRVGLTGFRCRCGELFCGEHRYSDRHDCSYDYKAAGREAIARENPVVKAAKIVKV
ncbi:hypothetical protein SLEP1_g2903 [Rubroshorea leprosula]|uniref:Zinc finger A20 and AN1 domain-containing stress-associated protein 5 n=1 Tax=Rubroshorea leprosula TaxID=152421 RepID=A0AAV5HQZ3_9ROSI|nr:hypothetical protein SLEP1_g2903 [Rubroshorea leprosula]